MAAASVLMLTFMGATLPTPLYVIYRDELHFSQITLTLIYAVYFGGALATAFFLGRLSDETGRRVAIFAAVALSMIATVVFIFADSLPMLFLARLLRHPNSGLAQPELDASEARVGRSFLGLKRLATPPAVLRRCCAYPGRRTFGSRSQMRCCFAAPMNDLTSLGAPRATTPSSA